MRQKDYLMRSAIRLLASLALLGLLGTSCNRITYEGDFTPDGQYIGSSAIYFDHKQQADTLTNYSFGILPPEVEVHEVAIPLRILGDIPDKPLTFHVVADPTESTAESGVHYAPLAESYQFRSGAVTDTLRVKLLRSKISADEEKSLRLVLMLRSSDQLKVAFERDNKQIITFDNYVAEPYFFQYLPLGTYHRLKYLKLLEYYHSDPDELLDSYWNKGEANRFFISCKKVYDYFAAHPELGVPLDFDPSAYIPFEE